jgi:hypothetical protein
MKFVLLKEYISLLVKEQLEVLDEAQIDDAIKNNPGDIGEILQSHFKELKPKYINWVVKELKRLKSINSNLGDYAIRIVNVLKNFDKFAAMNIIANKDINSYEWEELREVVQQAKLKKQEIDRKKEGKGQSNKIYEDDSFLVIEPQSEAASCAYGKGTQWCISATNSQNHWNHYTEVSNNKFIFVINKKKPSSDKFSKLAFKIKPNDYTEVFDVTDEQLGSQTAIQRTLKDIIPDNIKLIINDFAGKHKGFPSFLDYLTKDYIMNLSNEKFSQYIASVSTNPEIQSLLARYSSFDDTRIELAYNNSISPEALNILSKDSLESVRFLVARNPHTPSDTLLKLSDPNKEPIERVRSMAQRAIDYRRNNT